MVKAQANHKWKLAFCDKILQNRKLRNNWPLNLGMCQEHMEKKCLSKTFYRGIRAL